MEIGGVIYSPAVSLARFSELSMRGGGGRWCFFEQLPSPVEAGYASVWEESFPE